MAANLKVFERVQSAQSLSRAAVAVVVLDGDEEPSVPIFQRTARMSRHAGQMALPGGRLHEGEMAEEGAIRELREELGLAVDRGDVIGVLDDFDTRSGFTITPVVIWSGASAATLQASPDEVALLFLIPVAELRAAVSNASPGQSAAFSLQLEQVEVFAPTAAILYQFTEVALNGRPVRVADFYQPPFTHR
jgi:8-oxo-dGTP pyrophosphatase MutT (NUDIX family)